MSIIISLRLVFEFDYPQFPRNLNFTGVFLDFFAAPATQKYVLIMNLSTLRS